jgi:hypothetical protein
MLAFALQRGFVIARSGRPDVYRAANLILRLTCDGRILLSFKPPLFFSTTKYAKYREVAAQEESKGDEEDHDVDSDGSYEEPKRTNLFNLLET